MTTKYNRLYESKPMLVRAAWLVAAGFITGLAATFMLAEGSSIPKPMTTQQRADEDIISKARLAVVMKAAAVTNTTLMFSAGPHYSPELVSLSDVYGYNMARMELCRFSVDEPEAAKDCRHTLNMDMKQRNDLEDIVCLQARMQSSMAFAKRFCQKRVMT